MRLRIHAAALGVLLCSFAAVWPAAAQHEHWMIIGRGTVTTSSLLFPNPNSPDPVARSQSFQLDAAYGYGGEIRYIFPEVNLAVGLSVDYLRATLDRPIVTIRQTAIPVKDGYTVVPIELTGYFIIPFSGPVFGVYIGGGGGVYPGRRQYSVGNVESSIASTTPGGGIHVLAGVSYRPISRLTLLGEMKFRDVQFKSTNLFPSSRITVNGTAVEVSQKAEADVHTDGVVFQLGLAFSF